MRNNLSIPTIDPSTQSLHCDWKFWRRRSEQWIPAKVPGYVHTDLPRAKLIADPFWGDNDKYLQWIEEEDWTYSVPFSPNLYNKAPSTHCPCC